MIKLPILICHIYIKYTCICTLTRCLHLQFQELDLLSQLYGLFQKFIRFDTRFRDTLWAEVDLELSYKEVKKGSLYWLVEAFCLLLLDSSSVLNTFFPFFSFLGFIWRYFFYIFLFYFQFVTSDYNWNPVFGAKLETDILIIYNLAKNINIYM